MDAEKKQYVVKTSYNNGIDLVFGNSIHGKELNSDDVVEVTYLVHDGEEGNLNTQEETYFVFDRSIYDTDGNEVDGNAIFNITFASHDSVTSGSDSESKEYVRQMIGMNSRALVLASPEHYKTFINKFSFCGYNRTWSEKGSMIVNSMILKNFKLNLDSSSDYFNLTESDFLLSENQKKSILDSIETSGKQLGGISYNIIDPIIRKYSLYIYIKMKNKKQDKEFVDTGKLSDSILTVSRNINYSRGLRIMEGNIFQNCIDKINRYKDDNNINPALTPILETVTNKIKDFENNSVLNFLPAVEWYIEHDMPAEALSMMKEGIVSYLLAKNELNYKDSQLRLLLGKRMSYAKEYKYQPYEEKFKESVEKIMEQDVAKELNIKEIENYSFIE